MRSLGLRRHQLAPGASDTRVVVLAAVLGVAALACTMAEREIGDAAANVFAAGAALAILVAAAQRRWSTGAVPGTFAGLLIVGVPLYRHADDFDWFVNGGRPMLSIVTGAVVLAFGPTVVAQRRASSRRVDASPWQLLTGGVLSEAESEDERPTRRRLAAASGIFLAMAVWPLSDQVDNNDGETGLFGMATMALMVLLVGLAAIPIARREVNERRRLAEENRRALERHTVAAHLHDSVLQTLSLIQRTDDADRVKLLARKQERSLRSWLAGRDESAGSSFVAALRAVCADIEDDHPGVEIGCVTAGDIQLDDRSASIVWAAREAIRNAAAHAGKSEIRVFAEVEPSEVVVYVRDTGPGFVLGSVPEERRGVRDAILGRMEHAGGGAEIDSGPTGTEVVLRLPLNAGSA